MFSLNMDPQGGDLHQFPTYGTHSDVEWGILSSGGASVDQLVVKYLGCRVQTDLPCHSL